MDNTTSIAFLLFCFCCITLISGVLLGYMIGKSKRPIKEHRRLVKEKIWRNKMALREHLAKKKEYVRQIDRLVAGMCYATGPSKVYIENVTQYEQLQKKLRECEQTIDRLSLDTTQPTPFRPDTLALLIQLKNDPVAANLTKEEWDELLQTTDLLFNNFLTELKEQSGITVHEQHICCLIKWRFARKDQMAIFNCTTEALTKSKYRLKKRLRLGDRTDLDQFIRLY